MAGPYFPNISWAFWLFGIWKKIGKNMSCEKNLTACPKHPECMINSDYLPHRNKMLAKQRFATLPNLRHQPNPSHNGQICYTAVKSVGQLPNLCHCSQICRTAAKSLARQPILWLALATKSVALQPNLWTVANSPNLWHGSQIWGNMAKSVAHAQQPNLWHSSHICDAAAKSVARWTNRWHGRHICSL